MIILVDAEKEFHKIQHSLIIILKKLKGKFNMIEGIYKKSTDIILNGRKLDVFPLR